MRKILVLVIMFVLSGYVLAQTNPPDNASQQPATSSNTQNTALQPGSLIYAELSKTIDAKKAKAGDPVSAKITQAVLSHGKVLIPKNTKVVGHLTSATAHTKDQSQSELGIAFDRAELKDGTQVPLTSVSIQAMASAAGFEQPGGGGTGSDTASSSQPSMGPGMPNSRPGGNMGGMNAPMGGSSYPSSPGSDSGDVTPGANTGPTGNSSGHLSAGSRGVIGMSGVKLEPEAQGGKVIVDGKNVKLDSGTQLVLRAQ